MNVKESIKIVTIFLLIVFVALPVKIFEEIINSFNVPTGFILKKILNIKQEQLLYK